MKLFKYNNNLAIGLLSGCLIPCIFSNLTSSNLALIIAFFALFASYWLSNFYKIYLFALLLGFILFTFQANNRLSAQLDNRLISSKPTLYGYVEEIINNNYIKKEQKFILNCNKVCSNDSCFMTKSFRVKLLNKSIAKSFLKLYTTVSLQASLKTPKNYVNPGGYDLEKDFFLQNLKAHGSVVSNTIKIEQDDFLIYLNPVNLVKFIRYKVLEHFWIKSKELPKDNKLGLILALTLGDKSLINHKDKETLLKTGTSHLLAISGMHLGFVAILSYKLVAFLFRKSLINYNNKKNYILFFSWLSILVYAILAGFGIPVQRAIVSISTCYVGIYSRQNVISSQNIAMAVILVLILFPLSVLSVGFWLSFVAVFSLWLFFNNRNYSKAKSFFFSQWAIFIGLLPFSLYFFNVNPLIAPLANVFAIPFVSIILMPLSILTISFYKIPIIGEFIFSLTEKLFSCLILSLGVLQDAGLTISARPSLTMVFFAVCGSVLVLTKKNKVSVYFGMFLIALLFYPINNKLSDGELKVVLLDVGQGLAVHIQTKSHNLLFDTGPRYSKYLNAGNQVIVPYLRYNNIHSLDSVIVSHLDLDHKGGFQSIKDNINCNNVYSSEPKKLHVNASLCKAGKSWVWDGVTFKFIAPTNEMLNSKVKTLQKRNNKSCVLKITSKTAAVLLTADIEKPVEKILLKNDSELSSDIMTVPHHGSKTSSSDKFIKAVNPKYALIARGYNNIYDHPKQEIVNRYTHNDIALFDTVKSGAIIFNISDKINILEYKKQQNYFWSTKL